MVAVVVGDGGGGERGRRGKRGEEYTLAVGADAVLVGLQQRNGVQEVLELLREALRLKNRTEHRRCSHPFKRAQGYALPSQKIDQTSSSIISVPWVSKKE